MKNLLATALKRKEIAIGISTKGVFFVQYSRQGILKSGERTHKESGEPWSLSFAELSAALLLKLFREREVKASKCVFTLSCEQCRFATVSLPLMGKQEMRGLLARRDFWRERLSVDPKNYVTRWRLLGHEDGRLKVFLVAAEQRFVNFYKHVAAKLQLKIAGIKVACLELLAEVVTKQNRHWIIPDQSGVCLISCQPSELRIKLFNDDNNSFSDANSDSIKRLVYEIESFFVFRERNAEIKMLILQAGHRKFFEAAPTALPGLKFRAVRADEQILRLFGKIHRDNYRQTLAAVAGIYRRNRLWTFPQSSPPNPNFLPHEESVDIWREQFPAIACAGVVALAASAGVHKLLLNEQEELSRQLTAMSAVKEQIAGMNSDLKKLAGELNSEREILEKISRLESVSGNSRLLSLSSTVPRGLRFKYLLLRQEGNFKIVGAAQNYSSLSAFIENMEKEKTIKHVVLERVATVSATAKNETMAFQARGKFVTEPSL